MMLKVEFVVPGGNGDIARGGGRQGVRFVCHCLVIPNGRTRVELLLDVIEEALCGAKLHARDHPIVDSPIGALVQHGAGWAAAVIAHAVQIHQLEQAGCQGPRLDQIIGQPDRIEIFIPVAMGEVGEHLAAIRRLPPENLERERG